MYQERSVLRIVGFAFLLMMLVQPLAQSQTRTHYAFGDSITAGTGATPGDSYAELLAADENATLVDFGIGGSTACAMANNQVFISDVPGTSLNAVITMMIGTNDANLAGAGAYEANFDTCQIASLAWIAVPDQNKVTAQSSACTAVGSWGIYGPLPLAELYSQTNGDTLTCQISTAGGPLYIWSWIADGNGGQFTYSIDGGPSVPVSNSTATPIGTGSGGGAGVMLTRVAGLAAGNHTVFFQVISPTYGTNSVMIFGLGTPLPATSTSRPLIYVGGVPFQENNAKSTDTAAYNADVQTNLATLTADGLNVAFVNVRAYWFGTPPEMYDTLHPDDLGHSEIANAFWTTENTTTGTSTPTVACTLPTSAEVGAAYSGSCTVTGGTAPFVYSMTGNPTWLSINSTTGALTGTPTTAGSVPTFTVKVTDSTSATGTYSVASFTVTAAPSLTCTLPPTATLGVAYTGSCSATGGTTPYTFSLTGAPSWMSISPTTGAVTGTPTATGTSSVTGKVTDAASLTATSSTTNVTVGAGLTLTCTLPPTATLGVAYTGSCSATGGTTPYTFSLTGAPSWMTISPTTGAITGTPNATGTSSVTGKVTDAASLTATSSTTNVTVGAALTLTCTLPATATLGVAYTGSCSASGGTTPYTFSLTGAPSWMTISPTTGAVTGTPNATGTSSVTGKVTDAASVTATSSTTNVTVGAALTLTCTLPATATLGVAYTGSCSASGGTTPYTFSLTGAPSWMTYLANNRRNNRDAERDRNVISNRQGHRRGFADSDQFRDQCHRRRGTNVDLYLTGDRDTGCCIHGQLQCDWWHHALHIFIDRCSQLDDDLANNRRSDRDAERDRHVISNRQGHRRGFADSDQFRDKCHRRRGTNVDLYLTRDRDTGCCIHRKLQCQWWHHALHIFINRCAQLDDDLANHRRHNRNADDVRRILINRESDRQQRPKHQPNV